jgi:hypothetical protein
MVRDEEWIVDQPDPWQANMLAVGSKVTVALNPERIHVIPADD